MKPAIIFATIIVVFTITGWAISPEGYVLYTPNDWATAQRTSGLVVGAIAGTATAAFIGACWLLWHIVRKAIQPGRGL